MASRTRASRTSQARTCCSINLLTGGRDLHAYPLLRLDYCGVPEKAPRSYGFSAPVPSVDATRLVKYRRDVVCPALCFGRPYSEGTTSFN